MFDWATLGVACAASFALGLGVARCAWPLFVVRPREAQAAVLSGTVARVSLAIPGGGVGAVAYMRFGRRATFPARACDGSAIERGRLVVIFDVERKVALVSEFSDDIQEVFQ